MLGCSKGAIVFFAICGVAFAACRKDAASGEGASAVSSVSSVSLGPQAAVVVDGKQRIAIRADDKGFTPSAVALKKGTPATLTFTRTSDDTCAKEVVFPEINLKKSLPLNAPVDVDVPTDGARTLAFTCGMGMFKSSVLIQ
jgi:plastocyanin domain-containing protein